MFLWVVGGKIKIGAFDLLRINPLSIDFAEFLLDSLNMNLIKCWASFAIRCLSSYNNIFILYSESGFLFRNEKRIMRKLKRFSTSGRRLNPKLL